MRGPTMASTTKIHFVGSRAKVTDLAYQLAAMIAGRAPDRFDIAKGFLLSIGVAALSDIRYAYEIKAKGGTDAMGIKWPPLAPSTIARRRVGPKDKANDAAIKERQKIADREYRKEYEKLRARLSISMTAEQARSRARQIAGMRATRQTGRTKVDVLGNRKVEILRDTGVLMNSLGPGELTIQNGTVTYTSPDSDGGAEQVLELQPGTVIVGTNVAYAGTHQKGSGHIPRRQILPENESEVPQAWWDNWFDAAEVALAEGARLLFEAESK